MYISLSVNKRTKVQLTKKFQNEKKTIGDAGKTNVARAKKKRPNGDAAETNGN